jgi:hypothetical protein
MEANGQLKAPTILPPALETPVDIKQEAVWAPKSVWKTQNYLVFAGNLWSLDIPARRLFTEPTELLWLEIQQSAMITSNLEPVNQGTPFCAEGPLLAAMLYWLVHLDSWCREHPTPLSHEGNLVNKTQKCMRMSVSVATAYESSMSDSGISPIHQPLTVNLISLPLRGIS